MRQHRSAFARGLAALLAVVAIGQFRSARSAPADVFSIPAPVIGSDPPKATELKNGDASVSSQTGALQYSYPIQVPPGRRGMAPQLALSYSSQAPIYGGIAAGWSLSIPEIREDTSQGRLRTHAPEVEAVQADPKADDRFVSSLAGGRPLVPVDEPKASTVYKTYRAQNDSSFARYERMTGNGAKWRVFTTDGTVMLFGEPSRSSHMGVQNCTGIDDGHAPLTTVIDAFGNEIRYEYNLSQPSGFTVANECRLDRISWGWNANAGLADFASVTLNYVHGDTSCSAFEAGSTRDYRTGRLIVMGASKLQSIAVIAYPPGTPLAPVHTRTISLAYSPDDEGHGNAGCAIGHAPFRQLVSIQETAVGTDSPLVTLPPVTFSYGAVATSMMTSSKFATWGATETRPSNLAWGYRYKDDRWPTIETMLLDVDGDGLLDRVTNTSTPGTDGVCRAHWQRNTGLESGMPHFAAAQPLLTLPRLKWNGTTTGQSPQAGAAVADTAPPGSSADPHLEGCSLNGQVTAFRNSDNSTLCHDSSGGHACTSGSDPNNAGPFCFPGGTECPSTGANTTGVLRTYLAYRWIDIDNDGLVDLVTAVHGDINRYDIEQGNQVNFWGYPENTFTWPPCPQVDRCKSIDPVCAESKRSCSVGQLCVVDWTSSNSMRTCIESAAQQGCSTLIDTTGAAQGPGPGGGFPPSTLRRRPYTRCEGLYPWFIYKNQGNGHFATAPVIKYQPVPLESDTGDSAIGAGGVVAQNHGVLDLDGDGILDAVARARGSDHGTSSYLWNVWLGDGTGGFGSKRYIFPTRNGPSNQLSGTGMTWSTSAGTIASSMGLVDVNGDGLLDHWLTPDVFASQPNANIAFHDGTQHRLIGQPYPALAKGELDTQTSPPVKPGSDAGATIHADASHFIDAGESLATNRVLDVDADGRIDVVGSISGSPQVFYNVGGQFENALALGGDLHGTKHRIRATNVDHGSYVDYRWEVTSDMIDLDGDGIPETAYFPETGYFEPDQSNTLTRITRDSASPPRLLTTIDNGRGGETSISYTSMHDASTVEQHPESVMLESGGDYRPKASPHNQWVVKSLTTLDRVPTDTTSTTSYYYKNPRFGADDEHRYAFRGFEEVTTTNPSGSKVVNRYSYAPDWSGRLISTLVFSAETPTTPTTIDTTIWEARQLFNGALTTYHATVAEHFICDVAQTEAGCTPSAAAGYTRTITRLTALASTTQPGAALVWQPTSTLLQGATTSADGDRETVATFTFKADPTAYRLRPLTTTRYQQVGGVMTMFAKSTTTWDADFLVPLTSETWFDSNDANRAIARTVYDMTTGNVVQRFKPKQNAANTTSTTFTYDSRKLFATTEVNELGHQLDYTFEYGTGTKLQTDGPNERSCTSNCPSGAQYPVKEEHKIRVDGLGRPIEKWDTTSDDGSIYTLYQRETTSYVDAFDEVTAAPTSVSHQTRYDTVSPLWKQEKTELDGHGRPIRQIVFAQGSAPADQITTFTYRFDGTLQSVSVPDPTANNASVVTYTYGFDSLGRATSIRRPDASAAVDQSGVEIAYGPLSTTTTEVTGAAGGQRASTTSIKDRFGRLVEVRERTSFNGNFPSTYAITHYGYGPDDIVNSVVDPEGVTTTMTHDFAGHRTQITRPGNRSWKYTYDKNGNVISEQVPGSPSPPITDPDYTTTIVYDDLDRVTSKVIGQRNLSQDDQALFGSRTEVFTWDYGPNHKGYVRYWQTRAPNTQTGTITLNLANDNQGHRTGTTETLNIAGIPAADRQFINSYYLFGGVRQARTRDYVGGPNETILDMSYDARLLPAQIQVGRPGETTLQVGVQTRNVAGLVTKRRTNTTGAMTFIESNWTYDKLGRVVDQTVQKGPGPVQVARQSLAYFGNDDPKSLDHYLGTTQRHFDYGYDMRHQLTSAAEATTPGYFSAAYAYGTLTGSGRMTTATEAQTVVPAGSEVKPRNVAYVYGGTDPEQVTALNLAGSTTPYATYTYDAAGNQLTRCLGPNTSPCTGELLEYVYDGKDQLRRVTKKLNGVVQGSEEYWYSDGGARTAIVKRDSAGLKTELVRFLGDTEAHYDGSGTIQHVFTNVSLGTPIARVDRIGNTTTSVEFQFHGVASSLLASVDTSGTTTAGFSYTPFGDVLEAVGSSTDVQRRRFNDKYQDELSALKYYGARYYDGVSIAWTQGDPLFTRVPDAAASTPRRASVYMFSLNSPLRYYDPDGRSVRSIVVEAFREAVKGSAAVAASETAAEVAVAAGVVVGLGVELYVGYKIVSALAGTGGAHDVAVDTKGPFGTGCGSYAPSPCGAVPPPRASKSTPQRTGPTVSTTPYRDPDWDKEPQILWMPPLPSSPPPPDGPPPPDAPIDAPIDAPNGGSQLKSDDPITGGRARRVFHHVPTPLPWSDRDEAQWMYRENQRGDVPIEVRHSF